MEWNDIDISEVKDEEITRTVTYVDDGGRWCSWLFNNKDKLLDNMIAFPNCKIDFLIAQQNIQKIKKKKLNVL